MGFGFRRIAYVFENPGVNPVNDVFGPKVPVVGRPHSIGIPGRPGQVRPAIGQALEWELVPAAVQEVFGARRVDVERTQFIPRRHLIGDPKGQPVCFIPPPGRLNEWPC